MASGLFFIGILLVEAGLFLALYASIDSERMKEKLDKEDLLWQLELAKSMAEADIRSIRSNAENIITILDRAKDD